MIKNKGMAINSLLLIGSGIAILLISLLTYIYILKGVYGRFEFSDNLSSLPFGSVFKTSADYKIAILYSDNTENLLPEGSTWVSDNVITWKKFLDSYKLTYTVIHDSDLTKGRHYEFDLFIVPGAKSLNDQEVNNLKKFIDKGGSVFATSGTSSFSHDKKWRGWEFFSEVFGLRFTKEIKKEELTRILTLRGGYPITSNIPTGYPLKVATWDMPIEVQVLEPRTNQVSYWFNQKLDTMLVREGLLKSAGIAYGTYGAGRFVWMGFELNSVVGSNEDFVFFDRLVHNSVDWLLYRPIANVQDWPSKFKSAAIITPVITEYNNDVQSLVNLLKSKGVKATYFIDPALAESNPAYTRQLAQNGELGAIVDIGYLASVNDTVNKLNDLNTQFEKIKSAADKIKAIGGKEVVAIMPAYGLFDDRTVASAAKAGYKVVLSDSLLDRSVPKSVIKGEQAIITIPKTARDDFEVIRDLGLTEPEFQVYTYNEDIDKTVFEGGLYVFKPHSGLQGTPENLQVISSVIDSLRARQMWITSSAELHSWWTKRNKIEMRVEPRSPTRVAITMSNSGKEDLPSFNVTIDLQLAIRSVIISSEMIGTPLPKYNYNSQTRVLEMSINGMKSGESRIYLVDFDRPS
ncbi:MAG: polysaccharide deacetylase family protein [Ignavibacteriales bacterium]|nr:polysaccharide deacetylase family protein [Ignavibacteriales bacterium]